MSDAARPASAAREAVLSALRDPASLLDLEPAALDLSLRVLRRARLLGRIGARLQAGGLLERLEPVAADQLIGALAAARARVRAVRWELACIARALRGLDGLEVVALKGSAYLLADTPNASGRPLADVDLMVPMSDLARVERRLLEAGWLPKELTPYDDAYYRRWAHELPPMVHVERDVELDLHHGLLMRTARLRPSSERLLAAARAVPGSPFKVLAPVDMTLHSMTHLFFGGEADDAVRELVDIDDLLRHFGGREPGFWPSFWPRARELDLDRAAAHALRQSIRWLGTPVPEAGLDGLRQAAVPGLVARAMDVVVPPTLFPQHPDRPSARARLARAAMYARAHWVRMPPLLLVRHLARKFYLTRLRAGAPGSPT